MCLFYEPKLVKQVTPHSALQSGSVLGTVTHTVTNSFSSRPVFPSSNISTNNFEFTAVTDVDLLMCN